MPCPLWGLSSFRVQIILLVLSQDAALARAIHKIPVASAPWYTERKLPPTTLGSLCFLVLVRAAHAGLLSLHATGGGGAGGGEGGADARGATFGDSAASEHMAHSSTAQAGFASSTVHSGNDECHTAAAQAAPSMHNLNISDPHCGASGHDETGLHSLHVSDPRRSASAHAAPGLHSLHGSALATLINFAPRAAGLSAAAAARLVAAIAAAHRRLRHLQVWHLHCVFGVSAMS